MGLYQMGELHGPAAEIWFPLQGMWGFCVRANEIFQADKQSLRAFDSKLQ